MADHISDGTGSGAIWAINPFNAGKVFLSDDAGASIDNSNPLPVTPIDSATTGSTFIEFGAATTVASGVLTTVLSFTNAGGEILIKSVGAAGTARSEWFVEIDSVTKMTRRMSTAHPFVDIEMFDFQIATSSIIALRVRHPETSTQDFEAFVRYNRP